MAVIARVHPLVFGYDSAFIKAEWLLADHKLSPERYLRYGRGVDVDQWAAFSHLSN